VLDGLVVAAVAVVAGGGVEAALRLGAAMIAMQASIGALNDLHDAPADMGRVPPKPIPAGLVSPAVAGSIVAVGALAGLVLAASVGPWAAGLAFVVLAIGYGYDLLAKGTAWSWLPFALGIPMLPVFGWLGAVGTAPPFFAALIPMAVLAGAALAIANARVDLERDGTSGTTSIATHLGSGRAWQVHAALWSLVLAIAVGWLVADGAPIVGIGAVLLVGAALAVAVAAGREGGTERRERAWEAEAVLVALALVVWLGALLA
jgi:4-hydroxybenzoate polyprenyltransferase